MFLYRAYGEDGTLLYVGVTNDPAGRVTYHKRDKEWWNRDVVHVDAERYPSRKEALAAEAAVIADESPVHNIVKANGERPVRPGQSTRLIQITMALYRGAVHARPDGDGPWEVACRAAGAEPSINMLVVRQERAPVDVAARLGIDPGALVVYRLRHMLADGVVCQIHAAWLPLSLVEGSRLAEPGIVTGGIFGELARIGRRPTSMSVVVGSRMPTRSEVRDMQLPNRVPLTLIERVTKGADGAVLELLRIASAADRVETAYEDLPLTHG